MRLLLIVLLLGLTACNSAWDKDPFKDYNDNVKNGVPQGTKIKSTPPPGDVVFIKLEPFYELKEGKKIVIETGYDITHREFIFQDFVVHDLEETFPGAVFDPATNEITWTPPEDYVPDGRILFRNPLKISVFGDYHGAPVSVEKVASINVERGDARAPHIQKVEGFDDIKEGQYKSFTVTVKDEVSPNGPILSVRNKGWGTTINGAGYIFHNIKGVKDTTDSSIWRFEGRIDLRKTPEITDNYKDFSIGFVAHSAYGDTSNVYGENFRVLNQIVKPTFFTAKTPTFKKNVPNTYSFSIVDIKQEGIVEGQFITDCSREPVAGADCSCTRSSYQSTCTINWVPQSTGVFEFEVKGINSTNSSVITESLERTQVVKIEVVE